MEEVPFAREHHGETELVGPPDDGLVAHGATRLDHCSNSCRRGGLDAVGEGIERVARAGAADRAAVRLLGGDLARLDAVLLPRADADGLAVFHEHDGVAL